MNKLHFGIRRTCVETENGVNPKESLVPNQETEECAHDLGNLKYVPPSLSELGGKDAFEKL